MESSKIEDRLEAEENPETGIRATNIIFVITRAISTESFCQMRSNKWYPFSGNVRAICNVSGLGESEPSEIPF